jgi:hypothetical protein
MRVEAVGVDDRVKQARDKGEGTEIAPPSARLQTRTGAHLTSGKVPLEKTLDGDDRSAKGFRDVMASSDTIKSW